MCSTCANRRHVMYNSANESNPDYQRMYIDQKFVYFMQFEWESVSQFLECAFDERKRMLYNVQCGLGRGNPYYTFFT